MSQLLVAYWFCTGFGFLFIIGTAAMGHFHGSESIEESNDPGDVDGDSGDSGDQDADGGDADNNDPGDVDSSGDTDGSSDSHDNGRNTLAKASSVGALAGKQHNRSLHLYLKLVGWLSPTKWAVFLFFFGAIGIITLHLFPFIGHLSILPAALLGYALGKILLNVLSKLVSNLHSSTNFKQDSLIGSVGELVLSIEAGKTGEVMVSTRGSRHSAPARASNPELSIKSLSKVMINDYRDGIFYVEQVPQDTE